MIRFTCSSCGREIGAPERYAGKRVRCPKCKAPTRVAGSDTRTSTDRPVLIKFRCPNCNQKIAVSLDYAGKRVRCAKCRNPLRVPDAPGKSDSRAVKDETEVLKAGHEQRSETEGFWGDLADIDELLLAEAGAPATENQTEPSQVDFGASESELPEYPSRMPELDSIGPGLAEAGRPRKKRLGVFIAGACVLVLLVVGLFVWYSSGGSGAGEYQSGLELGEVQEFAERYISLLAEGHIDTAAELLSPRLQGEVQRAEIESFAKRIGVSKIIESKCQFTHRQEHPEQSRVFLLYHLRYENSLQFVVVSILQTDEELSIDGIAAQDLYGSTAWLGPSSYEELSGIVLTAGFKKYISILTKFFCGIVLILLVLGLVQTVSMWVVFEKAGEPGWAVLVPFYNMWVLAEVGDKPGWLGLLMCFCGAVPFVGPVIGAVLSLVISIGVARAFGRGIGFAIGLFLVPFIFFPVLAFAGD